MKKLVLFVGLILCSLTSRAEAVMDTISYALGYQITLSMFAGENHLIRDDKDFSEYIRGLEQEMNGDTRNAFADRIKIPNEDPSYTTSYSFGGMSAIFFTDGKDALLQSGEIPVGCMIEGLKKITEGRIELPKDTIEAKRVLESFGPDIDPIKLEPSDRYAYYRAFAIMMAMGPELQELIKEFAKGKDTVLVADPRAFAQGMIDILDSSVRMPENAYEIGTMLGQSISRESLPFELDVNSFISGAKDVWGFGEPKIPRRRIERIGEECLNGSKDKNVR